MPALSATSRIRLTGAPNRAVMPFEIQPDDRIRAALAARLGFTALKKLRFAGELRPVGRQDWALEATLGATIVQPCGVTLAPVTTRIDEAVRRRYLAGLVDGGDATEQEMPEDEAEPLPQAVDLDAVMLEALNLAAPAFPRAEAAETGAFRAAGPGAAAEEEPEKPFARLAEKLKTSKP